MTSVNGRASGRPGHIAYLLHMALLRARADAQPLVEAEPEVLTGPRSQRLNAAHFRLLDQLPPDGIRVTDLAARTRITKQALGQLAGQLADRGFVEMVPDPSDRRAKLVRCTPPGARATRRARQILAELEDQWRAQVGAERYAVFREVLAELVDGGDPNVSEPQPPAAAT
jgi:DNA-binding MarR family transcriptional regulator